ncbi:PREDICTED: nucleolar protein 6-like [Vollenhovia emeryi]|uniref:nucleolar protein 6-like n=1 Tax=Vollenhovia emeryi TaxID=411798 RepID=UPI0005F421D2|nr:PREDICTED: nucleolar protein 6-like [Vollenhovia emeryi]
MIPRRLQAVDASSKAKIVDLHPYHSLKKIPVMDFDPVQCFLKDLRDGYGDYALFFHDTYGGSVIGVLLKPTALERKDFKVSDTDCRKLDADGKLILNISAMIEDFYTLGRGIVRTIDIPNKRLSLTLRVNYVDAKGSRRYISIYYYGAVLVSHSPTSRTIYRSDRVTVGNLFI